jgi:mRNA-degrading endonuclease RelE of RelBE toxin-antitoxin system
MVSSWHPGDCRILDEIDDSTKSVAIVKVGNRREV